MGFNKYYSDSSEPHYHKTHKIFLFCNYILLGASSSCIFLTLSLRLIPSLYGFLFILLHILTIGGAVFGCATVSALSQSADTKGYGAHMVSSVLIAIFQGSVFVLIFTKTGDFLGKLNSYVREEDGVMILRLAGGLCALIFCLQWISLTLAFFLKYYAYIEGNNGNIAMKNRGKVQDEQDVKNWPWPFQV
ncbi:uncharacterized protein LOC107019833 [Solanum pennellii]|uniref:Uncharacterized protein LOC107019833 n=1 Tax=Solanum pennellii TaxID=28526 RepID=A0ABM1GTA0_SOLPN|nr:uncharacterized protein LOC107019833 [Solanum pennellii]